MANYFTEKGMESHRGLIKLQEEKVRVIGQEAGAEAGMNCDWHDNFGYEDAKRRLEMEASALKRLKEEMNGAQTVSIEEQSEKVKIGVTVKAFINGETREYTIGAFGELDPNNGMITYNSPLGRAMLGMEAGDTKNTIVNGNKVEIEIDEIYPPSYRYHNLIEQSSIQSGRSG